VSDNGDEGRSQPCTKPYRKGEFLLLALQSASAVLIFLVTGIYAFFAYSQWQTMNRQWRTMEEQASSMRGQLIAMQGQLEAIKDQAYTMRTEARPYVDIQPIESDDFETRQEITLTMFNAGNSAAEGVNLQYDFLFAAVRPTQCGTPNNDSSTIQPHEKYPIRIKIEHSAERTADSKYACVFVRKSLLPGDG